jgi:RimJ/RimL family protein N-acetyltransferase
VEQELTHGIRQIGWHCWANNPGSINLAKKVGFKLMKEYPAYYALIE